MIIIVSIISLKDFIASLVLHVSQTGQFSRESGWLILNVYVYFSIGSCYFVGVQITEFINIRQVQLLFWQDVYIRNHPYNQHLIKQNIEYIFYFIYNA